VAVSIQKRVSAVPDQVPELRRELTSFVWRHCANTSELVSDVALATTEACDNVVRHAYPRGVGVLRLVARIDRRVLLVVVADTGVGLGDAAATTGSGFGLRLIRQLAHTRVRAANGTRVEMRFRIVPLRSVGTDGPIPGATADRVRAGVSPAT
jgi:anti-sigma regulatory factor (Ser/Thr protein kinase)